MTSPSCHLDTRASACSITRITEMLEVFFFVASRSTSDAAQSTAVAIQQLIFCAKSSILQYWSCDTVPACERDVAVSNLGTRRSVPPGIG